MRLLLDEMYGPRLAEALRVAGVEASTVAEHRLLGSPDAELVAVAVATRHTLLTENVADFTRIAAEHIAAGRHHSGLLIALSSRFSRRAAGAQALVAAIRGVGSEDLDDRVVYLEPR